MHALQERLRALGAPRHCWVAYSGGLDSHVLLHALAGLNGQGFFVRAVHVDHGLHPDSAAWAEHCRVTAEALGVSCEVRRVAVAPDGEGLEAAAREARHAVFEELLGAGEALLTAHHAEDQAETLLLHLLRGSGVEGLAGIPAARACGAGRLLRPLLGFSRAGLRAYAEAAGLRWLEDPSNADQGLDRNYLRATVWPRLRARWPGAAARFGVVAAQAEEASGLLAELAEQDLASDWEGSRLSVARLAALSDARRRNALRHWLREKGLRPPPRRRLAQGLVDLLGARGDAAPTLCWADGSLRRFRGRLYLLPPALAPVPTQEWAWDGESALVWPGIGRLSVTTGPGPTSGPGPGLGAGLSPAAVRGCRLVWRFRRGGERIRLPGRDHHSALKGLLHERGLPPWERERLPLLFADGELIAVADLWLADGAQAAPGEGGLSLRWEPA
ncbi:tRNA lysidine(34) synthetase TilS [Alkalilimnicola sp. S0819]|nr:tRNA lysidine(34) synthetase TilS [Alkalilimnicola sp. S0819]MPQ15570.1 tRNA lysidine(34) synthetase TilS [Alkalilimnicola sp. S0819]